MAHLTLTLSSQPAAPQWGANAILSFTDNSATIHISDDLNASLRIIKKAARSLEGLGNKAVKHEGEWHIEQQWAFAWSYSSVKKPGGIDWLDNADKEELEKRFKALLFTRDMINRAPNDIHPQSLASEVITWLSQIGGESISSKVISGDDLQKQGWT